MHGGGARDRPHRGGSGRRLPAAAPRAPATAIGVRADLPPDPWRATEARASAAAVLVAAAAATCDTTTAV